MSCAYAPSPLAADCSIRELQQFPEDVQDGHANSFALCCYFM